MNLYPFVFQPDIQARVWGGRALEQFGWELPEGKIGEAWIIADHPNGRSIVQNGELAGLGLDEVRARFGEAVVGSKGSNPKGGGRFPLLIKLLDCNDDLSVQVHPTDDYSGLPEGELGKTEMWYVLHAEPGARIIYGLKDGMTREAFEQAIAEDRILDTMNAIEVVQGDSFYIPAGTVHALGKGVLVAEIQQNSDTTYRLYDYNRPGLDGKPRELHIAPSLDVTNYQNEGATRMKTDVDAEQTWLSLAQSPYFVVEKAETTQPWSLTAIPDSFTVLIVAAGAGTLRWYEGEIALTAGVSVLVPASLSSYELDGSLTVIRAYLPV